MRSDTISVGPPGLGHLYADPTLRASRLRPGYLLAAPPVLPEKLNADFRRQSSHNRAALVFGS